eukprot:gene27715-34478_t
MLADLCNRTGATLVTVPLPLPIRSSRDLIDSIMSHVRTGKTKMVILDEITSNTALSLPVLEISSLVKALFSSVVDIYLTNGHKWLSAPKGCAFMWVSPRFTQRRGTDLNPPLASLTPYSTSPANTTNCC